jgi:hypothetical protein
MQRPAASLVSLEASGSCNLGAALPPQPRLKFDSDVGNSAVKYKLAIFKPKPSIFWIFFY